MSTEVLMRGGGLGAGAASSVKDDSAFLERALAAKGRSALYRVLAEAYLKEATPELLRILRLDEVCLVLKGLGEDTIGLLGGLRAGGDRALLDALAEEYAALFILPGGISPYESARLTGLLCREPEWKVRRFYKRCALEVREDVRVFADHIGIELDFMGLLALKESGAWTLKSEEDALQWTLLEKDFFKGHIGGWAPGFMEDVARYSAQPFYKKISLAALRFLESERDGIASS